MAERHEARFVSAMAVRVALLTGAIALGAGLAGCGQKGPLYLPDDPNAVVKPAQPPPAATESSPPAATHAPAENPPPVDTPPPPESKDRDASKSQQQR